MQIANRKHDVVAVQVYDPRAKMLPDVGLLKVRDAETGYELYIDTSIKKLRLAHTRYWMEHQSELSHAFAKGRIDWISIATNEDFVKSMMMLFRQRA